MKKTTINLILIIVFSALIVKVYSQGYGYNYNFDIENINPYYQSNYTPISSYTNYYGYDPLKAQTSLIINTRPIIINPYSEYAYLPVFPHYRPIKINPYPVYPLGRRSHIVRHIRRGQYFSRGCR